MKTFLARNGHVSCCLREPERPRHAGSKRVTGLNSTAHLLARLRINRDVTVATARLAADPPGSALIGRDSHPLDDCSEFHEVTVTSLLPDQKSLVATQVSFSGQINGLR